MNLLGKRSSKKKRDLAPTKRSEMLCLLDLELLIGSKK